MKVSKCSSCDILTTNTTCVICSSIKAVVHDTKAFKVGIKAANKAGIKATNNSNRKL